jgi:hypothetical protein
VRAGTCFYLRRSAVSVTEGEDGWDTVIVTARGDTAGWLAEYGADVVVIDPPALRDAVVAGLRAVATGGAGNGGSGSGSGSSVARLSAGARSGPPRAGNAAQQESGRLGVAS